MWLRRKHKGRGREDSSGKANWRQIMEGSIARLRVLAFFHEPMCWGQIGVTV